MAVFGLAESQAGGGHVWGDPVLGRGPKANNAEIRRSMDKSLVQSFFSLLSLTSSYYSFLCTGR
jgi:hypothetical protein